MIRRTYSLSANSVNLSAKSRRNLPVGTRNYTYPVPDGDEKAMVTTILYYGDNLDILREHMRDESVDLVYLDPPFNSNRSYNVLFREANGTVADSQIRAFDDTWNWGQIAEATLREIELTAEPHIVETIQAIVGFVGRNDVSAYLVMMTVRLIELHRVLKPTGSIYLHCDPTASHYLKVVMDTVFGKENFRNEIIWNYKGWTHQKMSHFPRKHDVILFYAKSKEALFHPQSSPWSREEYVRKRKQKIHVDQDGREYIYDARGGAGGRRYLDVALAEGRPVSSVWEIPVLTSSSKERLGYPTQKPLALLERIISASSSPGDLVLDPFCGCGTTVCAAQKLGRAWIGIDITHLAVGLMRSRLRDMFGDDVQYEVVGVPKDVQSARALALQDRHQFEWWALSLVPAQAINKGKKGADRGIDGVARFIDESKKRAKKVMVQVKSGHVHSNQVSELCHVVEREKAVMGFFITLEPPTKPMLTEALSTGYYHSPGWNRDYSKIQIRTIQELLEGKKFDMPPTNITLAQAERVREQGDQGKLL